MRILFIFLSIGILLQSCNYNTYQKSDTPVEEVSDIDFFESFSQIHLITKGNRAEYSDQLSEETAFHMDSILLAHKRIFKIQDKIIVNDSYENAKVQQEFSHVFQLLGSRKKIENIPIPPTIDSILDANNQRFGMAVFATGFSRAKNNYGGEIAKGIAVGVLTLGMLVPIPAKANISFYTIIIDAQNNNIAFYRKSPPVEQSPTNPLVLRNGLLKLYGDYLYEPVY